MVNQRYYEKLGGFSYLLNELRKKLGKEQTEMILKYGDTYMELFPNGKHKTAVQNAVNQAKADQ